MNIQQYNTTLFTQGELLEILLHTQLNSFNHLHFDEIQIKIDDEISALSLNNLPEFQQKNNNFCQTPIDLISTDSRISSQAVAQAATLQHLDANCLFIALVGERLDAHNHISNLANQGYKIAMTSHCVQNCPLPQIIVPDTLQALKMLAKAYRQRLNIPIIAVLGSNGKTTTKEMVAHLFKNAFRESFATQGNLNNHIGVPLSLLRIRSYHQAAVLEIGMNHIGETHILAEMVAPDISIITNAQREHQEFMLNVENVAKEHGLVAAYTKKAIVVPNQTEFLPIWQAAAQQQGIICHIFGEGDFSDISGISSYTAFKCKVHQENQGDNAKKALYQLDITSQIIDQNTAQKIHTPLALNLIGAHNAYNASAVFAAFHLLNFHMHDLLPHFTSYTGFRGRLQIVHKKPWIIDDTYNANPDSVLAAIVAAVDLKQQLLDTPNISSPIKTLLVLGDMGEVGDDGTLYHQEIGRKAYDVFDALITVGELSKASSEAWNQRYLNDSLDVEKNVNVEKNKQQAEHFHQQTEAAIYLAASMLDYQLLLFKGSRFMKMEKLVDISITHSNLNLNANQKDLNLSV